MNTFEIHECPNPSEPLGLGLGAQLGPLPEPLDWPDGEYTAQDMRAERERCYALGAAAERERCAKLCDNYESGGQDWAAIAASELAEEIRGLTPLPAAPDA